MCGGLVSIRHKVQDKERWQGNWPIRGHGGEGFAMTRLARSGTRMGWEGVPNYRRSLTNEGVPYTPLLPPSYSR